MSDRVVYLYGPSNAFNIRALVEDFASAAITLEHPANGRMTALSTDGDQIDTSLASLEEELHRRRSVTFQFWLSEADHADVCCRFRYLSGDRLVEEYSLEGLLATERERVLRVLVERFKAKAAREGDLFFVADQNGYALEVDWDELSSDGRYEFMLCPDVLAFPADRLINFQSCAREAEVVRHGDYVIIGRGMNSVEFRP